MDNTQSPNKDSTNEDARSAEQIRRDDARLELGYATIMKVVRRIHNRRLKEAEAAAAQPAEQ